MSLDRDAERVLEMIRASGRPAIQSLSPQEAREVYRASRKVLTPDPPDVALVDDLVAPGLGGAIPLRMYRGLGSSGKLPVLVFF
jgi:acetyl esterase